MLDLGAQPNVTEAKFRLDVDGAVENHLSLRLDEFMALPKSETFSDMHCVTQWSRYDNHWKGVAARALLAMVKPPAEVNRVIFTAYDGYTRTSGWISSTSPTCTSSTSGKASRSPASMAVRSVCWCRGCICGNRRSGCDGSSLPSATILAFGRSEAITTMPIPGSRSVTVKTTRRNLPRSGGSGSDGIR